MENLKIWGVHFKMKRIFIILFLAILLMNFVSAEWNSTFDNKLISYYGLGETSGTRIDSVGTYSLSNVSSIASVTGKNGNAANAEGKGWLYGTSSPSLTGNFTMNFWVYPTSEVFNLYSTIWDVGDYTDNNGFGVWINNNKQVSWRINQQYDNYKANFTLPLNTWVMITLVRDGTNIKLYKNGSSMTSDVYASPPTAVTNYIKMFAREDAHIADGNFTGLIDEAALWNRSLTASEIETLWNSGNGFFRTPVTTGEMDVDKTSPSNNSVITTLGYYFNVTTNITDRQKEYELKNNSIFIWYENGSLFNNTVVSLSGNYTNSSTLIDDFTLGNYLWDSYVCLGNTTYSNCSWANYGNYSFTVGANILSVLYNNLTYETARENFSFTIKALEDSEISLAQIVYNGTNYTITSVSADGDNYVLSKSLDIPLNANPFSNQTNQFFLRFTYAGSFVQEFSAYYQNSSFINLQLCNSTYNILALNFTLWDELNNIKIDTTNYSTTYQSTFNYWLGNGDTFKNYSYQSLNSTTIANYSFCLFPYPLGNRTMKTTMTSTYDAYGYSEREYNLYNSTLSNVTSHILLYLLDSSNYQKFTITVKEGITNLQNGIITVSKYFLGDGTYKTISIRKTDNIGQFVEYLELDRDYRYYVIVNGVLRASIDKRASCNSVPCEFTLQIDGEQGNVFNGYYDYFSNSTISSLDYNSDTKIVTYTFLDLTGLAQYFRLSVEQINLNATQKTVCDTYSYSSSGTITCNVTGYSGDFIARGYISRSPERLDAVLSFVIGDLIETLGKLSLLISFIIIITITIAGGMVTKGNPNGFLFGFLLSWIGTKLMTILPFSWVVVSVVGLLDLILIIEVNKR